MSEAEKTEGGPSTPWADSQAVSEALTLTQARQEQLDLQRKRLAVNHSLTLHREGMSAADIRAMLDALTAAGMPETASIEVATHRETKHTRIHAHWASPLAQDEVVE